MSIDIFAGSNAAWLIPALSILAFPVTIFLGRFLPGKGSFISTRLTSWVLISEEIRLRHCSKSWILSRTRRSVTITWTCRSICPKCCSSRPRTCSTRCRLRFAVSPLWIDLKQVRHIFRNPRIFKALLPVHARQKIQTAIVQWCIVEGDPDRNGVT